MTLPVGTRPPSPGSPLGTPTWFSPDQRPPEASIWSQLLGAAAVVALGGIVSLPLSGYVGWVAAWVVMFLVGVVTAMAGPRLSVFDRVSGLVVGVGALVAGMFAIGVIAATTYQFVPPGLVVALAVVPVGLDWKRIDRIRPTVLLAMGLALLLAVGGRPGAIAGAILVIGLGAGTLALLEADRRAGLPQVQQARAAGQARADDLLTTLLIAAAVALVAALVLSVPSCQRHAKHHSSGSGSGSGYGSGSSSGSGSGTGSGDHRYVPDPDGRFLVPSDGSGTGTGSPRIPSPDTVDGQGGTGTITAPDGTTYRLRRRPDGSVDVTVRQPDGTTQRYRYRHQPDGTTRIDRLRPDGSRDRTWTYDPKGKLAEPGTGSTSDSVPQQRTTPKQDKAAKHRKGLLSGWLRPLGLLLVVAMAVALGVWLLRRRREDQLFPIDAKAPPWAIAMAKRLAKEGADRGRRRAPNESIVRYGRALAADRLPDDRLPALTEVLSDALFSGRVPSPEVQAWAESTFEAILADHPATSTYERRKETARS